MNNLGISNGLLAKPTIGRSEYGRVKVALAPGKGFMDWLRLTSNKALAKRRNEVDHNELMKHDKKDDCWIHLFGTVYDVTQYLDFHPGGVPELLRAAGRDATPLFNQYHSWVNYQSMLKACIVGPFNGDLSKLPQCLPPTTEESNRLGVPSLSTSAGSSSNNLFGSCIKTEKNIVRIVNPKWFDIDSNNLTITLIKIKTMTGITPTGSELNEYRTKLRVLFRFFENEPDLEFCFEPTSILNNQKFEVELITNGVQINFLNVTSDLSNILTETNCCVKIRPSVSYHEFTISSITRINHDTVLFSLNFPENAHYGIPIGHHVSVKIKKGGSVIYRPYTPILVNLSRNLGIDLMIKIYEDGIATPCFQNLAIGDKMEISDQIGRINIKKMIQNDTILIILAAGTGITPMIDIIDMKLRNSRSSSNIYLFMFNKTEKDIQTLPESNWILSEWSNKFQNDDKFMIRNVLSNAEDPLSTNFVHGRISGKLLEDFLKKEDKSGVRQVFVCGPDGFVIAAKKSIEEIGISNQFVHVFQG